MKFTVVWGLEALDELTRLWTDGDSHIRKSITQAAHEIDRQLSRDPLNTGESRPDDERIWFVLPLGIRFSVDQAKRNVQIFQTWLVRKRKS